MAYKVFLDKEVIYKLDHIVKNCINLYKKNFFGKQLFNQIERVRSTIQYNPRLYPEIRPYHHKIVLSGLGYKLYYIVDDYNSVIVIYRLMKFYERYQKDGIDEYHLFVC